MTTLYSSTGDCRHLQWDLSAVGRGEENHKNVVKNFGPKNIANFSLQFAATRGLNMTCSYWARMSA